jgi:hypothetical protein
MVCSPSVDDPVGHRPDTWGAGAGKVKKYLHGEWFGMPGGKKSIADDGIWLFYLEVLILNAVWVAHPDVILFQFL